MYHIIIHFLFSVTDVTNWLTNDRKYDPNPPAQRKRRATGDVNLEDPAYARISPDIYDTSKTVGDLSVSYSTHFMIMHKQIVLLP